MGRDRLVREYIESEVGIYREKRGEKEREKRERRWRERATDRERERERERESERERGRKKCTLFGAIKRDTSLGFFTLALMNSTWMRRERERESMGE